MKPCRICKVEKPAEFFVKNKAFKSGIDTICLDCSRAKVKTWRKETKAPRSKSNPRNTTQSYREMIIDFLIKRDGLFCGFCKESLENSPLHIDHIIPVALGGSHTLDNVRLAHPKCNTGQSNAIRKQRHGY